MLFDNPSVVDLVLDHHIELHVINRKPDTPLQTLDCNTGVIFRPVIFATSHRLAQEQQFKKFLPCYTDTLYVCSCKANPSQISFSIICSSTATTLTYWYHKMMPSVCNRGLESRLVDGK